MQGARSAGGLAWGCTRPWSWSLHALCPLCTFLVVAFLCLCLLPLARPGCLPGGQVSRRAGRAGLHTGPEEPLLSGVAPRDSAAQTRRRAVSSLRPGCLGWEGRGLQPAGGVCGLRCTRGWYGHVCHPSCMAPATYVFQLVTSTVQTTAFCLGAGGLRTYWMCSVTFERSVLVSLNALPSC